LAHGRVHQLRHRSIEERNDDRRATKRGENRDWRETEIEEQSEEHMHTSADGRDDAVQASPSPLRSREEGNREGRKIS
jgi:hypothetical protein